MEKKLFWRIESNEDTSLTVDNLPTCQTIIETDIEGRPQSELEELQFTITPIFLTEDEYADLPEAD